MIINLLEQNNKMLLYLIFIIIFIPTMYTFMSVIYLLKKKNCTAYFFRTFKLYVYMGYVSIAIRKTSP